MSEFYFSISKEVLYLFVFFPSFCVAIIEFKQQQQQQQYRENETDEMGVS